MKDLSARDAVDWENWTPEIRATLLFARRGDEVLLIRKKRGLGAGKINGPGGKIDPGETPLEAAIRETREEVGITPHFPVETGELFFQFCDGLSIHCVVFFAHSFSGELIETDEAVPLWTRVDEIPYDEMWEDDRHWLPLGLAGRHFRARFLFDGEKMLTREIEEIDARAGDEAALRYQ